MSKQVTRQTRLSQTTRPTKQDRRRDRREEQRRREEERLRAAKRRRFIVAGSVVAAALIIVASVYYFVFVAPHNPPAQPTTSADSTPINTQVNPSIDGVACNASEQLVYHVHAHLSIYINGQQVQVPQGIGIATDGSCLYWLHTHDATGVIHIESPSEHVYTLGNFFHLWSEEFPQLQYPLQLENNDGWQVYVNGKLYKGDFHNIPLSAHALITMTYNTSNAPIDTTYNWGSL